jgi:dGTPase
MTKFDTRLLAANRKRMEQKESTALSSAATLSSEGVRREPEQRLVDGYRQCFSVDVDRILHSRAYSRYIDKTQVFYLIKNDHITHRVLHVQLVSKIARTIGRCLKLNEDLIEAIALGHDIGHTPFGHDGERFLSDCCRENDIGHFQHNLQSIQFLERVERKGSGWNLCLQTLDGILCHDGEVHNDKLRPQRNKSFEQLAREIELKKENPSHPLVPMTLEGCVVRMADTVSYVGRDIEDAIRLGLITRSEIPRHIAAVLGDTNGTIVFHLVTDIIQNSIDRDGVAFSPTVSEALQALKAFNLERIYRNPRIKQHTETIRSLFGDLFRMYLADIERENKSSVIFRQFLKGMAPAYLQRHKPAEIVRDFIAGMTDDYFLSQCPADRRPGYLRI